MNNQTQYDVVIIGAGLAGLTVAISLAELSPLKQIALITKSPIDGASSFYAQGGIAAANLDNDENDSVTQHVADTVIASANSVDQEVVAEILSDGSNAIEWLIQHGVIFDKVITDTVSVDKLHLAKEGGHSARRIAHVADHTGSAIIKVLWKYLQKISNISVINDNVINLLVFDQQCTGVLTLNNCFYAKSAVVLATGGLGQIYTYTTNPIGATGDGIALAYLAGAKISNMEFIQFHPTVLYNSGGFLISEALRGEGAYLYNHHKERFMMQYDSRLELAPRDIVARAIYEQIQKTSSVVETNNKPYVWLDISHKDPQFIIDHFPSIYNKCLQFGYDITKEAIPIVPAAHYCCGGIDTNLDAQTSIKKLYAVGECANSGLHGANRLASNSLLECVIMARKCVSNITLKMIDGDLYLNRLTCLNIDAFATQIHHIKHDLQELSWKYLGIARDLEQIKELDKHLSLIKEQLNTLQKDIAVVPDKLKINFYETRNIYINISLITEAVKLRTNSLGTHFVIPSSNI